MFFQCFGRLQARENEISLRKWSGGTALFRTLETGACPASNVRVGYFSGSQSHNGFAKFLFDFLAPKIRTVRC